MSAANGAPRRVVLVDFDWQDADLLPQLLQQPGFSVRLVAGERSDDAGVRLAELCGLPRTVDLADLTREIFDLALVSERSARRTQIEGLLLALGTPSVSPQSFLAGGGLAADTTPGVQAPLAVHAAAFETTLGGEPFDALVEKALSDLSSEAPSEPQPVTLRGERQLVIPSLENFPTTEDRQGLETALRELMHDTGAGRAELHMGGHDQLELVVEVGPQDPLLKGLVALAIQLGTPQIVGSISGSPGKAWGAWPFRTPQRRGVLAAAGIEPPSGWAAWQRTVEDLRSTWDQHDREIASAAFPMLAKPQTGWLSIEEFSLRLELALERNRRDGMRFALHRLTFAGGEAAFADLSRELPGQLRDTDCITIPGPNTVVLLTAGTRDAFTNARRRLMVLWERVWHESGQTTPAPAMTDERIEMHSPAEGEAFLTTAGAWIAAS
ncbi:MAG TPA: hypothetical protein VEY91_05260 [Candidatus Limnocylindria bacterium]|nr:hypothetical protein [Candidatus Limnocylindria bacterium]